MKYGYRFFIFAFLTLFVTSCDDITEVEKVLSQENIPTTGAPVINKIVLATDVEGTPITSASFTQVVRIEGSNLGEVKSVRFNDREVDLKEVYSSYGALLAKVPRELPLEVTDKVYVENAYGTASAPLVITVPELKIEGLYCEYAQPGDTTYIQGNDFDLYGITAEEAIVKVGDVDVNVIGATETELMIQIPRRAKVGDPVTVQGSKMAEPVTLDYAKPGVSNLFDWNNWPGVGAFTHASKYSWAEKNFLVSKYSAGPDDPKPLGADGKYLRFKDKVNAWGWMVFWAGYIQVPEDVAKNPSAYQMRFEFWNDGKYPLDSTYRIIFGNYQWYPGESGIPLNTNKKWKTIRIDLDDTDPEGNVLVPAGTDWTLNFSFMIIFSPTAAQTYNLAMTNFRFVKK